MDLDPAVLARLRQHIAPLEDALDSVAAGPSPEKLEELRDAADKLMRALGRVLIELGEVSDGP